MRKQLELFSVDDMYGCIGVKDEIYAVAVAAYLWAIWLISELDDERYCKVKKECDAVKIGEEKYFIPSIPGSMNIFRLNALRDCLKIREYAMIGEKYIHHYPQGCSRPHISDSNAFNKAKKAFQRYHSKEFEENSWWMDYKLIQTSDIVENAIFA